MRSLPPGLIFVLGFGLGLGPARANPIDAFGFGARAPALGSAYSAVADDSAAGYYNPAGLARSRDMRIDLGYQAALPQLRFSGAVQPVEATRGMAAGLVVPGDLFGVHLAFGLTLFLPDQHVTRLRTLRYEQPRLQLYDNRTQRLFLAANLAVRIVKGLYVGAGLTFMSRTSGDVSFQGNVTVGDAERSALKTAIEVNLVAVRYPQAGIAWEVNEFLALALVYRHSFILDVDQRFQINADLGNPGQVPIAKGASLVEQAQSVDLFQPWQVVLGGALRWPSYPRLLLSADLTFARWSDMPVPAGRLTLMLDIGSLNSFVHLPPPPTYPSPGFHDILIPAVGVEWRALDSACKDRLALDLRAGYRYEASPVPGQQGASTFGDADKHTFSLGAGVELRRLFSVLPKPIELDAFVAVTYLPERDFNKDDPRSLVGDFTVSGTVFQVGGQLRWRL